MTTGAVDALFLDTNVLVYATAPTAPLHAVASARIAAELAAGHELWISRQILREYLSALSRPQSFTPPFSTTQLIAEVTALQAKFIVAESDAQVTANLLGILGSISIGGKQIHDANIVATMQRYGIRRLLTHNIADFTRFSSHITVLPLVP
jgi:predicted nucleic acid-binding protein